MQLKKISGLLKKILMAGLLIEVISVTTTFGINVIDFEAIDGAYEGMPISNKFESEFGVTFSLEDSNDANAPVLAWADNNIMTAFYSEWGRDTPAPEASQYFKQDFGHWCLTDDGIYYVGQPPTLIATYTDPVSAATGYIIDIDTNDEWRIEARDISGQVFEDDTIILDKSSPGAGDGMGARWLFDHRGQADIKSLRFFYTGLVLHAPSMAFDNFLPSSTPLCIYPPEGIVAWWPFDENETPGGISHDIVNDNDGFWVSSPTPIIGVVDRALDFNGISDYVNVRDAPDLNLGTGNFSIDAWIRTTSTDTYEVFVDKRDYNAIGYEFLLYYGKLTLGLGDINGWSSYYNPDSCDIRDGNWHFVAVTVDRDDPNGGKLYCDGELIHTFNPTIRAGDINNSADLWIGRHHPVSIFQHDLWFDGSIDEVELFNRTLTVIEVKAIFRTGGLGKCKDCNHNRIPDWEDIDNGTSLDCQHDGIPDECQECELGYSNCNCSSLRSRSKADGLEKTDGLKSIWYRQLSTRRFRWRKVGDPWGPGEHKLYSYVYADVDKYDNSKNKRKTYPESGDPYPQHRCKRRDDCKKTADRHCCDDSCGGDNQEACQWVWQSYTLLEDYAINGEFCNPLAMYVNFIDEDWWWESYIGTYISFSSSPDAIEPSMYSCDPAEIPCDILPWGEHCGGKIETEWHLSRLGYGNETGFGYCVLDRETHGNPGDIIYFRYGQISGTELKFFTTIVCDDLRDPTLLKGVREINFCVDTDDNPCTGCPDWPFCGADCRVSFKVESNGTSFGSNEPNLTIWCWDCHPTVCDPLGWVLKDGKPYDPYVYKYDIEVTAKLKDIGNPQASMSAWVVYDTTDAPTRTLPEPLDCEDPGLQIVITPDDVCPWVKKVDTVEVTRGELDKPIGVVFSEPMAPIGQSDVVIEPPLSVSLSFDSTERILYIDPTEEDPTKKFVPGRYTVTLSGDITDASGNFLDGNHDFSCKDSYVFELCVPDPCFIPVDEFSYDPNYYFALGKNIWVSGLEFPKQPSSFYLYLVAIETVEHDGELLIDESDDGRNLADGGTSGLLVWGIGAAVHRGEFTVVADIDGDGRFQAAIDRVIRLCGIGLTVGGTCDVSDDIFAWWPLDEADGSDAAEELIERNNAMYVGEPTAVPGMVRGALSFDGVNDYLLVADDESLDFDIDDFSIDSWVKTNEVSGKQMIVDKRAGTISNPIGYSLYLNEGDLCCQLADTNGYSYYNSSLFVADGNWKHIALTVDRDNLNGLKMYVNGVEETFNPIGRNGSLDNDSDLLIAADCFVSSNRFNGIIDELNLFDIALTHDQVLFIYNAGASGKCQEPMMGDVQVDWRINWGDVEIIARDWLAFDYFTDGNDPVYHPLESPANLYDEEPVGFKSVNLKDFTIMANHWLEEGIWR